MKIAFYSFKPYDKLYFEPLSAKYDIEIKYLEQNLNINTAILASGCTLVCCFVNDTIDANVIVSLSKLGIKGILLRCSGYNNVDIDTCHRLGMPVMYVPAYSPEAVSEYALALCLCLNRQIHRAYNRTKEFNMSINGLLGTVFYGKTAGIIGTGSIGKSMARLCKGFGMKVLAYDPYPTLTPDYEYVDLDTLFEKSNLISLHCPLTKDTHYIINERSLSLMPDGCYLVNTSRGALIDTDALIDALTIPGKIGGVGLDVYEDEAGLFYTDHSNDIMMDEKLARLTTFPNVIITSHQGYFTKEALQTIANITLENAKGILTNNINPKNSL